MTAKLTKELSHALRGTDELQAVDPATGRLYVIVDRAVHTRAKQALADQEAHAAIRRGIESMEAGGGEPLHFVMNKLREELQASDEG